MLPTPMIAVVMSGPSVGSAEARRTATLQGSITEELGVPPGQIGGIGDSGFGRIHGPDGLNYAQVVAARQGFGPVLSETPRPHRLTVTQTCAPLARRPTSRPLPQAEPPADTRPPGLPAGRGLDLQCRR